MNKIKEIIYDFFVRKNAGIKYEYERYVKEHIDDHNKHRLSHWKILLGLNWHYRIRKKNKPMLYLNQDIGKNAKPKIGETKKTISKYLPYLDGAESRCGKYISPSDMVSKLLKYDVISFDIFDTLIFRPFGNPRDLFFITGGKLDILNFREIRAAAEDELRKKKEQSDASTEITLKDIYEEIHIRTGLETELGINKEIETEKECCFANPYMKYVFDTLLANEKRIILTTDMYIESDMMTEILENCGYKGYEKLFISCEYKCSKRNGGLYSKVKEYLGEDCRLVHVGDNEVSDISSANVKGIETILYENVNKTGNKYRAIDMSLVVGSAYRGIVNSHLHNGFKRYDAYYEFGYIYGGLFALGYCNYIHELAKKNNADKILFVSRDGYLLKQIYEYMYNDIDTGYVFWSRIVGLKLCAYKYKNDYMKEFVYRWINENKKITFFEVLKNMEIESLADNFHLYTGLGLDEYLTSENRSVFEVFVNFMWEKILKIYDEKSEAAKKYMTQIIGSCKKVCIVDIGWRGQGALAIRSLFNEKWNMACEVYGTVAASAPTKTNSQQLAAGVINSYMFSPLENIDCFKFHSKNAINNCLTEILVGAPHPSLKSFVNNGDDYDFIFDVPEVSNYKMIESVHKGVKEFVDEYVGHFKKYPFMFNISGHDAYMPIMYIFKDYKFIKRFFGKYEFQDFVGGTIGYKSRTIKDVFNKFQL